VDRYIVYVVNIVEIDPRRIKHYDEARFDSTSAHTPRTRRPFRGTLVGASHLALAESQPTYGRSIAGLKVYAVDFDRLGASYSISAVQNPTFTSALTSVESILSPALPYQLSHLVAPLPSMLLSHLLSALGS
jgi:hypothetical protein